MLDITISCNDIYVEQTGLTHRIEVKLSAVSVDEVIERLDQDTVLEAIGRQAAIEFWDILEAE